MTENLQEEEKMTHDEAVRKLTAMMDLMGRDPEKAHSEADAILLKYLEHNDAIEIAAAYRAARDAVGFWYA